MNTNYNRRRFVKHAAAAGLVTSVLPHLSLQGAPVIKDNIRLGFIGVGLRGQSHLEEMLKRKDVTIVALADPDKKMMADAQKLIAQYKQPAAKEFTNGNYDYKKLLEIKDIDAVFIVGMAYTAGYRCNERRKDSRC